MAAKWARSISCSRRTARPTCACACRNTYRLGSSSDSFTRIEAAVSFDKSRFTFNPRKSYSGVVMQQGRVQIDADWNEWLAELTRRIQAGTLDILGRAAYPATTPHAFEITASSSGGANTLTIGPGRMYVDGLL